VTIVIAWVSAKVLSTLGRWLDTPPVLARYIEMGRANRPDEPAFGTLGLVFAMVLFFVLLMPSTVTLNGRSISLHEVSDSMRASQDVATLATFVGAWRADDPLAFWGFFAGLLVTVIMLFRRSPALFGAAVTASLFVLWLKMNF
jgi:hypothetical protein